MTKIHATQGNGSSAQIAKFISFANNRTEINFYVRYFADLIQNRVVQLYS